MRHPRLLRSYDLDRHLTLLFVSAVSTVLLVRGFLAATGYPQVGNSSLHIAHVLWGGLGLTIGCIALLALLGPATKPFAAIVGGIGFGLFIDEVGKFVTKDVNYFYRPAISIIYTTFVLLFLAIRWLAHRRFSALEATLIGLEALQRAATGTLSDERRDVVIALLRSTGDRGRLATTITTLLTEADAKPDAPPTLVERALHAARGAWARLTAHTWFRRAVFAALALAAIVSGVEVGWLLRNGLGALSFPQGAYVLCTAAADVLIVLGAFRLRDSLVSALKVFEHAVLLEILVGQIFLFTSEQLAATLDLLVLLAIWAVIRWGIHFEGRDPVPPEEAHAPEPAAA